MKNYTLLLSFLLFCTFSLSAQVPFQGVVTTNMMPIKKAYLQDYINIVYHTSFDGNIKVFIDDQQVLDKTVLQGEKETLKLGGNFSGQDRAIMKIVLDDLYFMEQVIYFYHPFIRIDYQKEDLHVAIHYEDALPKSSELDRDILKEQVDLVLRERLSGLDK